ncbi:hypothetical protein [Fibrella arboris]|uniref:hypothetical protein n=1 Tax=Fibrella arboris TaxID=3242486 RepID=UPI003522BDDF
MRWDAPYDWNNDQSSETIFAFPGTFGRSHWQDDSGMYYWMIPFNAAQGYNNNRDTVRSTRDYTRYIRDQVGWFKKTKPGQVLADKESNMNHADQNSGIYVT